ncbi:DUF721 domain-containing protein [Neorhodopirellula pilleata]|uniref:DUF721 domain-containing protein n=1 Tax=Neorhodopirellula pilleata TaxID=2714738 RepID=A0A5C6APX6_9BACT|nr:DUF721 domain-containing protein [Neorhodopirellula pilleata]TWU01501.1 hypothetical protein Pla100_12360 [Neorhodopirellula pilleata]
MPPQPAKKPKPAGSKADERGTGARKIGTIVSQLMSRRGYASVGIEHAMTASVAAAVGPGLNESFQIGKLTRGVLHIYVVDSVTMQEFTFQKRQIQKRLLQDHPQAKIQDIRFRLSQ